MTAYVLGSERGISVVWVYLAVGREPVTVASSGDVPVVADHPPGPPPPPGSRVASLPEAAAHLSVPAPALALLVSRLA